MNNKKATTDFEILPLISQRWSPRAFDNKTLDYNDLMSIFEAGRWAASAMNEQPWRFVYANKENKELFDKIFDSLAEGNKIWVKNAPVLIAAFFRTKYSTTSKDNKNAKFDTGLAIQNMTLQALSKNIYLHPIAGFDFAILKSNLEISDNFEPALILAAGYLGNPDILPEDLKTRELAIRIRKNLNELVFSSTAGF